MISIPPDYPEEYKTGKVRFFGRDFIVTPDVLIPRLETESLVRRARQIIPVPVMSTIGDILPGETEQDFSQNSKGRKKSIVVDIGCGSGIIGTSVADLADEVIFLDISPEALRVAEENFRIHFPDKKAQFIVSDLLSVFNSLPLRGSQRGYPTQPPLQGEESNTNILFLTNLPYIRDEDWQNMSADTIHEPKLALFGGEKTGFELYERLFEQFDALAPLIRGDQGGFAQWMCIFEFGFDQRGVAEEIVKKYPHWEYSFFADYAGIERFGEINLR